MVLSVWVLDESDIVILVVVVAGNVAIADSDVAVAFGESRCGTGVNGVSWGEQGGVGRLLGLRLGFWGRGGRSVK